MLEVWETYKTELKGAGSSLIGSSVTGNSFQFGPRSDMTLAGWSRAIQDALSQVDPDWVCPENEIVVRF